MAPTIYCIRHGQGFHNVEGDHDLPDPQLTRLGQEQAEDVKKTYFLNQTALSLVVASPLCRTLHTASIIFRQALESSDRCTSVILALPDIQETSDDARDVGFDPEVLRHIVEDKDWPVDFSLVRAGWNDKALNGRYSPQSGAINARARDVRILFRQWSLHMVEGGNDHVHVVLVTHGIFLHYFPDDWEDADGSQGMGWRNCETRPYVFEKDYLSDEDAMTRVVETVKCRQGRGKMHAMYSRREGQPKFEKTMESWEKQGLQRFDRI